MIFKNIYSLNLLNTNGQTIKKFYCIPEELKRFQPSEDYKTNCYFLTNWAEDRKKELLKILGKNKGCFNLCCWNTETGNLIAGSDYIFVE